MTKVDREKRSKYIKYKNENIKNYYYKRREYYII